MAAVYYFTHTQIRVDPAVPVRDWSLTDEGRARVIRVTNAPWMSHVTRILTSSERRMVETAEIFAVRRHLRMEVNPRFHDSKRPLADFLSVNDLAIATDRFFFRPEESARPGWETAVEAQKRIVAAVEDDLAARTHPGDLLIVGFGRVGTLLLCHLAGLPIALEHFQPTSGGNLFAFDRDTRKVLFGWRVVAAPV